MSLQDIKDMNANARGEGRRMGGVGQLAGYLRDWWKDAVGAKPSARTTVFLERLVAWYERNKLEHRLKHYEDDLRAEGMLQALAAALPKAQQQQQQEASSGGGQGAGPGLQGGQEVQLHAPVFLRCVLLPIVDEDSNGVVTRDTEMVQLQLRAEEYAEQLKEDPPQSFPDLLDAVFGGLDAGLLKLNLQLLEESEVVRVVKALDVTDVLRNYKVSDLLALFVPGSREWLYQKVTRWLQDLRPGGPGGASSSSAAAAASQSRSRMFMLLAGPGLG